jgi:YfiH family protein
LIKPDWPLINARAFSTTRTGGVSGGPWAGLNLGSACGDDPAAVDENRRVLRKLLPSDPLWLKQVHGRRVIHARDWSPDIEADAIWTDEPEQVLAILSADCLPLLLVDSQTGFVGAAHAGWRGLAADIPGQLVSAMPVAADNLIAWIGPGIGAGRYIVGESVQTAFRALNTELDCAFFTDDQGRIHCDLARIARLLLSSAGVTRIDDCQLCTASDAKRFYSYRRDRRCGRMATLIWRP